MGQPSSKKNEMTIRHQFDRFCQKILHDEKVDYITINEQIQNIAQKKDTLCRRMYN